VNPARSLKEPGVDECRREDNLGASAVSQGSRFGARRSVAVLRVQGGGTHAEEARQDATAIAHTDFLTGSPNRRFFLSLLADRMQAGRAGGPPFALGLLDLHGLKPINDIHGHAIGATMHGRTSSQ
jgi:GGDEF domain-containing protein